MEHSHYCRAEIGKQFPVKGSDSKYFQLVGCRVSVKTTQLWFWGGKAAVKYL